MTRCLQRNCRSFRNSNGNPRLTFGMGISNRKNTRISLKRSVARVGYAANKRLSSDGISGMVNTWLGMLTCMDPFRATDRIPFRALEKTRHEIRFDFLLNLMGSHPSIGYNKIRAGMKFYVICWTCFQFVVMAALSEVVVTLDTPTNRYLCNESVLVMITISNGTSSTFYVGKGAPFENGPQMYWCVSPKSQMESLIRNHFILSQPHNAWKYVTQPQIGNRPLTSGETILWDYKGIPFSIPSRIFENFTNVNLYAQILVGSNVWAYSNTNVVKSTPVMIENGVLLFESVFTSPQRPKYPFNVKIYEHVIDGERFLFDAENFQRICIVPENTTPNFSINTNAAILTVTFSGTNAPPLSYNLNIK